MTCKITCKMTCEIMCKMTCKHSAAEVKGEMGCILRREIVRIQSIVTVLLKSMVKIILWSKSYYGQNHVMVKIISWSISDPGQNHIMVKSYHCQNHVRSYGQRSNNAWMGAQERRPPCDPGLQGISREILMPVAILQARSQRNGGSGRGCRRKDRSNARSRMMKNFCKLSRA